MKMCGLAEVLNQILIHIYDPMRQTSASELYDCIQEQAQNLSDWWDDLPDYLKLVATDLPSYCPPSHIMILKYGLFPISTMITSCANDPPSCLYHTINILLHRPILCSRELLKTGQEQYDTSHLVQCMASATSILSLFDLYRRTFGDTHVVLSLAYSIYTAASIFLLEIQALKYAAPGTLDKLKFCIFSLERVKMSNPVMTTALSLIYQELQKLQIDIHITMSAPAPEHEQQQTSLHPQQQQQQHPHSPSVDSDTRHRLSPTHQPGQHPHPQNQAPPPQVSNTSNPMIPSYSNTFHHQVAGFDLSHTPDMSQMPPNHLLGGMPNAVMTVDDLGSYEITPEVFEAFSYAQPISTNMTPAFGSGWGTPPA